MHAAKPCRYNIKKKECSPCLRGATLFFLCALAWFYFTSVRGLVRNNIIA